MVGVGCSIGGWISREGGIAVGFGKWGWRGLAVGFCKWICRDLGWSLMICG